MPPGISFYAEEVKSCLLLFWKILPGSSLFQRCKDVQCNPASSELKQVYPSVLNKEPSKNKRVFYVKKM